MSSTRELRLWSGVGIQLLQHHPGSYTASATGRSRQTAIMEPQVLDAHEMVEQRVWLNGTMAREGAYLAPKLLRSLAPPRIIYHNIGENSIDDLVRTNTSASSRLHCR